MENKTKQSTVITELLSTKRVSGQNESFPPPHTTSLACKHVFHNGPVILSGATQPLGRSELPAELKTSSAGKKRE